MTADDMTFLCSIAFLAGKRVGLVAGFFGGLNPWGRLGSLCLG
jgi:hypothetical protein